MSDFNMGNFDFTIAAWIYMTQNPPNPQGGILSIWNVGNSSQRPFGLFVAGTAGAGTAPIPRFQCFQSGGSSTVTPTTIGTIALNTWHFIVGWYDTADKKAHLRLNDTTTVNAAGALTTNPAAIGPSTVPLRMGGFTSGGVISQNFDGVIFSAGAWKSAPGGGGVLTAGQITSLYNGAVKKKFADLTVSEKVALVAFWDLTEATGTTRMDSVGTNHLSVDVAGPARITAP
jgi:hypothetical protein